MPLYDFLHFDFDPPPELAREDGCWQTSDTDYGYMGHYTVGRDGCLRFTAPIAGEDSDERDAQHVKCGDAVPFHGDLHISGTDHRLRFTEGRLVAFILADGRRIPFVPPGETQERHHARILVAALEYGVTDAATRFGLLSSLQHHLELVKETPC